MEQQHDQQVVSIDEEASPIFGEIRKFLFNLLQKIFPPEKEEGVDVLTREAILSEFENKRLNCFAIAQGAIEAFCKNEEKIKNKMVAFEARVGRMVSQTRETAICYIKNFDLAFSSEKGSKRAIAFRDNAFRVTDELGKRVELVSNRVRERLQQECRAELQKQSRYLVASLKELKTEDFPRIKRELTIFVKEKLQKKSVA